VLCLLLAGCARHAQTYRIQGQVFGTVAEVTIYGEPLERAQILGKRVFDEFNRLHRKLHAWRPSELTTLNECIARGERCRTDSEMIYLLKSAALLSERSGDTFNPAIGHLLRLWGFQSDQPSGRAPSREEIARWTRADPRMSDLRYEGDYVWSVNSAVMLDLGGYAKGYALDEAARVLRSEKVRAALINVGGNILAIGRPGERPWVVGIQDPRREGAVAQVELHDNEAIGASGDYRRYFMSGGERRTHIIDPRTGQSVDLAASVTIIVSSGEDAGLRSDGYSKPLFVVGPRGWREMAAQLGVKDALLIDTHGEMHATSSMLARMNAHREHDVPRA
jgi:thiamine biosynthesis lipoprotein